ncbi:MAG TPA: sugar ABC transporter permease [Thermomicrobiales bacterium]|jgi:glucose/mannose transport system permease protein
MAQSKALREGGGGAALAPAAPARRRLSLPRGDMLLALLALSPSIIAVAVFIYGFIIWTGYISVVNWNDALPTYVFVGLANFARLFETERFRIDLRNTAIFAALFITQCLAVGFGLALLLDQRIKGESILRTIYLLPFAVSSVVTGVAWRWLMTPSSGINRLFEYVGLDFLKSGWYTNPRIGIAAVTIVSAWQMSGYVMSLYLAGLRGIATEIREAAAIDGATGFTLYRHIIIPLLTPVTLSASIILGTYSLRLFDITAVMTSSGQGFSTDTPAFFMFQTTFQSNKFSQGSAIAVVMLLLALLLIIPNLIITARTEKNQ